MQQASLTSLMAAYGRIRHAERSQAPVFDDRLAKELMTDEEYRSVGGYLLEGLPFFAPDKAGSFSDDDEAIDYLVDTQIAPTPLARTAFVEGELAGSIERGVGQYVILGAGMDTYAFRGERASGLRVFELDHPRTQADKLERIERAGWSIPGETFFVPVDLNESDWAQALVSAGFDRAQACFVSWLGVTYYLDAARIEAVLGDLARLMAPGSVLAFDFADEGIFQSGMRRVQNTLAMAQAAGEPMVSCFSSAEIERLLARSGFRTERLLSPVDIQREVLQGKDVEAFEHIWYAKAVRA